MAAKRKKPKYTMRAARNKKLIGSPLFFVLLIVAVIVLISEHIDNRREINPMHEKLKHSQAGKLMEVIGNEQLPSVTVDYTGFTVNFNPDLHIPNYVAWELTADEVVGAKRNDKFWQDNDVKGCPAVANYRNSGYDKGHMCPAADMKWSPEANLDCYSMANMAPQIPKLNTGPWKSVEEKCRARVTPDADGAHIDSALIIICGPVPNERPVEYLGDDKVAVPKHFFKVILAPFARDPYAIGFIMPNTKIEGGMQPYATTIDEVEKVTGYDFFSALPDSIEQIIESKINFEKWSRLQ